MYKLHLEKVFYAARLCGTISEFKEFMYKNYINKHDAMLPSKVIALGEDIFNIDGVTIGEACSKTKATKVAAARKIYYYIMKHRFQYRDSEIAEMLNKSREAVNISLKRFEMYKSIKDISYTKYVPVLELYEL